jgi:DNA-binding MarR family transcriptional regulator
LNKRTSKPTAKRSTSKSAPWSKLSKSGLGLNIEDFLTFRLTRLSNALRTNMTKRYLEEFGLSLPEWRLLALVTRFSPLRFSELTSRSSMDKGQVSRTLRIMTKRGLTKMKALKRGTAYAEALAAPVIVSVTPKGKALYKAVLPTAQRRQAEILLTLSDTERTALYNTLEKLFSTVGAGIATDDAE